MKNHSHELRSQRAPRLRMSAMLLFAAATALTVFMAPPPAVAQEDAARRVIAIEQNRGRLIRLGRR